MNGRELIKAAYQCKETERHPWAPFVGCHAGALIEKTASEYLKSADLIVEGVQKAIDRYRPDGIPVLFDLQVEAEALGCGLQWADDNPPSVVSHPLLEGKQLSDLSIPGPDEGRIGIALDATRCIREANPEVALFGLITGPFTLALHLLGTNVFMLMYDDPDYVAEVMAFCRDTALAMAKYYIEAGCDVVAIVDPMTSQIGPDQFEQFVSDYVSPVFESIREQGALGSFFVCGHAEQNIPAMCATRPDNISVDENIPLDYVRDVCLESGTSFGGNMKLTSVLLLGGPEDAERDAMECMTIGGTKGFVLAPGCDLPYAVPAENIEAVSRLVRDEYRQDAVRTMTTAASAEDMLDMSHYGDLDKVIVDIITLDSEACAPCQYMVEAVKAVTPHFKGIVEWREHKIKRREEIVFMTSLMVKNVPTICIDGQITFVSRIPPREEIIAAIQKRINEKIRARIQRRRASVFILSGEKEATEEVEQNVRRAITELGADLDVKVVDDEQEIMSFGISPRQTPAVVVARYQVKSTGDVPEVAIIKEWLRL